MTRSLYIIGSAGSGKSTFTGALLDLMGVQLGPLEELAHAPNKKNEVYLRGHYTADRTGLYLGCMRDQFPGTDGLDRASSPVGELWLRSGSYPHPAWLLSEGATLATERFMRALHDTTRLMVAHLKCRPGELERRFLARGSSQASSFVINTRTRSRNLRDKLAHWGAPVMDVDTEDIDDWMASLDMCHKHLKVGIE